MMLRYASDTLKNDRDVVLAAVQHNGMVLHYASANLRNDQDIVLAAVQQHGDALQYASDGLRNDQGVVLVAVQQHGRMALLYASANLKNARTIHLFWLMHIYGLKNRNVWCRLLSRYHMK